MGVETAPADGLPSERAPWWESPLCLGLVVFVLPRATAELDSERARLGRWTRVWLALLTLATLAEMILRAQTMAGGTVSSALTALPLVLARTHFGALWIARLVALFGRGRPVRSSRGRHVDGTGGACIGARPPDRA